MMPVPFSNLLPDERPAKVQYLIRECSRDVSRLSGRLPLPIGTSRRLWQNLLLLAQIFSDNYNEDQDETFSASRECEQSIDSFRAWIGLLTTCDLPIPERQLTNDMRKICAELMLQRLIFMIEHIKQEGLTPETETPLRDLETFKHGLLRNLWAGIRRQEKLASLEPGRRIQVIAEIKKLEYELATIQYDTPEFADWENRYQNVMEQADRMTSSLPDPAVRAETEGANSREAVPYVQQTPWQIRARLQTTVQFENVQAGEVKTVGTAVLAYRAGLMKTDNSGSPMQNILEHKALGISRFSPER